MKKIKTLVFTFLLLFFSANLVQAMSLDEIYRDVVRSDNRGYLPMFVKNRTAPDFLDEEVVLKDVPEPKPEDTSPVNPDLEIVKLENQRKIHEAKLRAELAEWQAVKILGNGELTKKLNVKVNAVSETAKTNIEAAGGTVEVI